MQRISMESIRTKVCWYDLVCENGKYCEYSVNQSKDFASNLMGKGQSGKHYAINRAAYLPEENITIGKIGEFIAAYFLALGKITLNIFPNLKPDCTIKKVGFKNWDCDLPFSKLDKNFPDCHVKTCDQGIQKFLKDKRKNKNHTNSEYSWTFQYSDESRSSGRDALLNKTENEELILFMYVPFIYSKQPKIIASAPWNKIQGILKEPLARTLKNKKRCIYSEDLLLLAREDGTIK